MKQHNKVKEKRNFHKLSALRSLQCCPHGSSKFVNCSHTDFEAQNLFMNLKRQLNIQKSFKVAIINVVLTANILIATYLKRANPEIFSIIIGILILLIIILSIIGFSNAMKGIREPKSFKKVFGLIVNSLFVAGVLWIIGANIIAIYNGFK